MNNREIQPFLLAPRKNSKTNFYHELVTVQNKSSLILNIQPEIIYSGLIN
jgi:hypothetical protein